MDELEKEGVSIDGLMPFCLALQSFLGFLWLLDSLGVEVNVVVHGMWELWRFEVGVDLSVPLLLLLLLWAVCARMIFCTNMDAVWNPQVLKCYS